MALCLKLSAGRLNAALITQNILHQRGRHIHTLAIETSCDDTSVALVSIKREAHSPHLCTNVLFHERITAKSEAYHGIHPLVALHSHQTHLAQLVQKATRLWQANGSLHNEQESRVLSGTARPDFISVTRGPGMRSNLSVGLDTAKGLALAWNIPLIGVHHMQAHALTPRLCSTLFQDDIAGRILQGPQNGKHPQKTWCPEDLQPSFPFLSVLVSGGHTILLRSQCLIQHEVLAETADIAIGDYLDKAARAILPESALSVPYGKALEDFAYHGLDSQSHDKFVGYEPPMSRQEELSRRTTEWGWSLGPPLSESKGGVKTSRRMLFSFSGLLSSVQRLALREMPRNARRELAREALRVAFEHIGSRILLYLGALPHDQRSSLTNVVVSGGVASSRLLRHVLRSMLDVRGYDDVRLLFPPVELCTDNALMIAWAGWEMYNAGYESALSIKALRKWSMDAAAGDGGIVGVSGWLRRKQKIHRSTASPEQGHAEDQRHAAEDPG